MKYVERYKRVFIFLAFGLVCLLAIFDRLGLFSRKDTSKEVVIAPRESIVKKPGVKSSSETTIAVYISGEVKHPGVYILPSRSRIGDVLGMAGGFTKHAAKSWVNLASKIKDGQHIHFPSVSELHAQPCDSLGNQTSDSAALKTPQVNQDTSKVNINTANQSDLESLSGIGPATAIKILEYRKAHGKFSSLEDLKNIPGIGDKKVEAISGEALAQ